MDFVDQLKKERALLIDRLALLNDRIKSIDELLKSYGVNVIDGNILNGSNDRHKSITENKKGFPISGRSDKQVLWIFNNRISKGSKLNLIQQHYDTLTKGSDLHGKKINNAARRLNKNKKLVMVKYNNVNMSSFWGLPEWIEENDFKKEYRPDDSQLPVEIVSSEVL